MGAESNEKLTLQDVKTYIMQLLEKSKKGTDPSNEEMSMIISNIEKMDHHDLVRVDQILTRKMNKNEIDYQWGSIVMNCKWKNYKYKNYIIVTFQNELRETSRTHFE